MRVNRSVLFTVLGAGTAGCLLSGVDAAILLVDRAGWVTREFAGRSTVDDVPVVMVLTYLMPVLVGLFSLLLVRRWPYVLLAGGLLTVPPLAVEVWPGADPPSIVIVAGLVAFPLLLVGVLSCAQVLFHSGFPGWGAAVAAATYGVQLVAAVPVSTTGDNVGLGVRWYALLTLAGLGGMTLAVRGHLRLGRTAAVAAGSAVEASRPRNAIAGMLAAGAVLLLAFATVENLVDLLGVPYRALDKHPSVVTAIAGMVAVVIVVGLVAVTGSWRLGGMLAAVSLQIALTMPMILVFGTLSEAGATGLVAALAGVIAGGAAAASRLRMFFAACATALTAVGLVVVQRGTGGVPSLLAYDREVVPAALLLMLMVAAGTATVGAAAPVLARRRAGVVLLGPAVAALVVGSNQVPQLLVATGQRGFLPLTTPAAWLTAAAAALGVVALAELLAARRLNRAQTERVRREAAEAERVRLARPIHDGVLQVLSLVQRHGPELGERGEELAALAGTEEAALRALINTGASPADLPGRYVDLRTLLNTLITRGVQISAPAEPVVLPIGTAEEIRAAVAAALDNVRRHAGPGANAWVLVEREPDGIQVTVRDDGCGMAPGLLAEAAEAGRLGVVQSMRGRIADLSGETIITSSPGEGTEVAFRIPLN
jgi:signal transduction histidine kinase